MSMLWVYGVCVCYMYWIQYAPASCRQWSKETLVCKSLVCFCLLSWTLLSVLFPLLIQKSTGNVIRLWILVICTMADVVVLNLCTLALQTLDCRVLSGNNNHNKFILFQRQRRPEYIKCKVTLLYHYDYIEIKASSSFHIFFLKSHCLYNYFNIQYLIKVKLLFSALVFTIISYIITDYNNLADEGVRCSYKGRIYYNNDQNNK